MPNMLCKSIFNLLIICLRMRNNYLYWIQIYIPCNSQKISLLLILNDCNKNINILIKSIYKVNDPCFISLFSAYSFEDCLCLFSNARILSLTSRNKINLVFSYKSEPKKMHMQDFDDVRFSSDISYSAIGGPQYSTNINYTANGQEYRNINNVFSVMKYNICYILKTAKEIEKLVTFFRARHGKAIGFRFKDWSDYKAEKQLIGIGNGVDKVFQLKKVYKSGETEYQRTINKPVADSVEIYFNDIQIYEGFTVDYQFGKVKFNSAVPIGTQIFSSFEFDVPVRFDIDYLPISIDGNNTYSSKNINLIEIKI